jgi:hypothetical protein
MFLAGKHLALERLPQTADASSKTGKKSLKILMLHPHGFHQIHIRSWLNLQFSLSM